MKKRFILLLMTTILCILLAGCTTKIEYQPAQEADITKIQNTITDVYQTVEKGCVGIHTTSLTGNSIGSGVIYKKVDKVYYVVTNAHVIDGSKSVKVYLDKGRYFPANVIGSDKSNDVAVVTFTLDILANIDESELYVNDIFNYEATDIVFPGQTVLAIGCPISLSNYNVLTTGVISSVNRLKISHNADINPGNSGGGLFNLEGRLIGINYEKETWTTSAGERIPVEGRFFTIPLEIVKNCIKNVEKNGDTARPVIGLTVVEVNSLLGDNAYATYKDYLPADNNLNHLVCEDVVKNSTAYHAGLLKNDVIIEVNKESVNSIGDFDYATLYIRKGDLLVIKVYRAKEGKILDFQLKI